MAVNKTNIVGVPHRVFIIDNHRIMREGLVSLLEHDKRFLVAGESQISPDAFMQIKQCKPDIIILDIDLLDMENVEYVQYIKKILLDVKLVFLLHSDSINTVMTAVEIGAAACVLKQHSFEELIKALQSMSDDQPYLPADIQESINSHKNKKNISNKEIRLNSREIQIIKYLAGGLSTKEIALKINKSPKTIDAYRRQILKKLNLETLADLIKYAIIHNIILID